MLNNKKVAAILIARQGSTRLPGKALTNVLGKPIVWHIINRLKKMPEIDIICLATSDHEIDRPLLNLAKKENILGFAGPPEDVLDRIYKAAKLSQAEIIFEIGGDCPFVDYEVVKKGFMLLRNNKYDFVSNISPPTYPDGLDVIILTWACLQKLHKSVLLRSQRIHPFSYIFNHPKQFKVANFENESDLSHLRLTIDYPEDLELVKTISESLYPSNPQFGLKDILRLLDERPELKEINKRYVRPTGPVGYWNTPAYIDDLHDDLTILVQTAKRLNKKNEYKSCEAHYREIIHLSKSLLQRSRYLQKNAK